MSDEYEKHKDSLKFYRRVPGPRNYEGYFFNGSYWQKITGEEVDSAIIRNQSDPSDDLEFQELRREITVPKMNLDSRRMLFLASGDVIELPPLPEDPSEKPVQMSLFDCLKFSEDKMNHLVTACAGFGAFPLVRKIRPPQIAVDETKIGQLVVRILKDPALRDFWESRVVAMLLAVQLGKELLVLLGPRYSGKGFLKEIMSRLGGTYVANVAKGLLTPKGSENLRKILYGIGTPRMILISETNGSDKLDTGFIKELTDGRNIDSTYRIVLEPVMNLTLTIVIDTNTPLRRTEGDSLIDRIVHIPVGPPIPVEERLQRHHLGLESQHDLEQYGWALLEKWVPRLNDSMPKKTDQMKLADEYEEIFNAPLEAFRKQCIVIGRAGVNFHFNPTMNIERVYRIFNNFMNAKHQYLCRRLNFDYFPDGSRMPPHEVDALLPGVTWAQFKDFMCRRTGETPTRDTRSSSGLVWRNLHVKEAVVFHLDNAKTLSEIDELHTVFTDIDEDVQFHERVVAEARQAQQLAMASAVKIGLDALRPQVDGERINVDPFATEVSKAVLGYMQEDQLQTASNVPMVNFVMGGALSQPGEAERSPWMLGVRPGGLPVDTSDIDFAAFDLEDRKNKP